MRRRTLNVYPVDAAATAGTIVTIVLAVFATGPWCAIAAPATAALFVLAYLARQLAALQQEVFAEGMRTGINAKQALHLADRP